MTDPEALPQDSVIEDTHLATIFEELYTEKQRIHPVSFNMPEDADPSAFLCSGGSSNYFMQPIDRDKRTDLKNLYKTTLRQLASWRPATIAEADQMFHLNWELEDRLDLLENTEYFRPIDGSAWSTLPQFLQDASGLGRHAMHSEEDFEHAAARIHGFAEWADIAVYNMDDGIRREETVSQILGERALRVMTGHLKNNAHSLREAFAQPLHDANISTAQRNTYRKLVDTVAVPTYARLYQYMQFEYLPYCKDNDQLGLFYMSNGREQYDRLMRYHTSDSVALEQVMAIAEEDYHQSLHSLEALASKLGFDSAAHLTVFILNDTTSHAQVRPFTEVDQVLTGYAAIAKKVQNGLPDIFLPQDMPNDNWRVLPVTDHTASMTPATYTNGIFRAPIPDATRYNAARMHKLFLHEVNPGHHAQNSIYEQLDPPKFLRHCAHYPGLNEGWSMYAETLAAEIGVPYSDWEYAARLCSKVSTAALALIDVGIHRQGWSLREARRQTEKLIPGYDESQEAIFLLRNAEWPAQIHAYVYGEVAVRGIREAIEKYISRPFNTQQFHNILLRAGQKPLTLLREQTILELAEQLYATPS